MNSKVAKLLVLFCLGSLWTTIEAQTMGSGQSQMSSTPYYRTPNRVLRRAIVEGSLANIGYEGSQSNRYAQPNGFTAGILVDIFGVENFVVEMGAVYRQLGTNIDNGLGNNKLTANYISVPISAKYYLSGQESNSFYAKVGVMGSTLISNNKIYSTPTTRVGAREWETALIAGIGVKLNLTESTDVVVEGGYARAIESLLSNDNIYRLEINGTLGLALNL